MQMNSAKLAELAHHCCTNISQVQQYRVKSMLLPSRCEAMKLLCLQLGALSLLLLLPFLSLHHMRDMEGLA